MKDELMKICDEIIKEISSSLFCTFLEKEVRNTAIEPQSYVRKVHLKFQKSNGIKITFSVSEKHNIEIIFIGKKGHFSIQDYIEKYKMKIDFDQNESVLNKINEYIKFIKSDIVLSNVLDGQDWPDVPCTFGGMK